MMRNLGNNKLDEIGKLVVKSGTLASREIEDIVSNPALFDSIRARIATEETAPVLHRNFLGPGLVAFASVALVAAVVAGFVVFRSGPADVAINRTVPTVKKSDVERSSDPGITTAANSEPEEESEIDSIRPQRTVMRQTARTERSRRPVVETAAHDEDEFYAVSYAGDPNETERGSRIIRVDMPRSALFAMGVNIPLENEAETIKADLLVGNDGVTRGIRVVK